MEDKALAYFSSINPLAKKIVSETQLAKNVLKDDWDGLDWRKKEEALDNFFVDRNVREKYNSCTKEHHYAVSFPKLFIQSGEKIIVDMDSDVWSWQDVHSAPFVWRSKSQQDLSFADLDPEKLSKPQPSKGLAKTRTSPDEEQPTAPNEFTYNAEPSIWETEKYKDWKSNVNNFVLPETKENYIGDSGTQGNVRDSCISDELQPSVGDGDLTESSETSQMTPHPPKRRHKKSLTKSPVATRLKLSSSFSKRRQEGEEEELVTNELSMKDFPKAHKDLESNVFDNPIMNIREQSLVDEETESTSSTTSSPSRKPLLREPLSQVMERADRQQTDMFDVKQTLDLTDDTAGLLEVTEFHGSVLSGTDHRHTLSEETTDDYRQEMERPNSSVLTTGFTFLDEW